MFRSWYADVVWSQVEMPGGLDDLLSVCTIGMSVGPNLKL
jgi:hypothetical protein